MGKVKDRLVGDILESAHNHALETSEEKLHGQRGCLLAGPGRGDCEHFIGKPRLMLENIDEYGRPLGWCEICWRGNQIENLRAVIRFASGYISGMPKWRNKHPQDVYDWLVLQTLSLE